MSQDHCTQHRRYVGLCSGCRIAAQRKAKTPLYVLFRGGEPLTSTKSDTAATHWKDQGEEFDFELVEPRP